MMLALPEGHRLAGLPPTWQNGPSKGDFHSLSVAMVWGWGAPWRSLQHLLRALDAVRPLPAQRETQV